MELKKKKIFMIKKQITTFQQKILDTFKTKKMINM